MKRISPSASVEQEGGTSGRGPAMAIWARESRMGWNTPPVPRQKTQWRMGESFPKAARHACHPVHGKEDIDHDSQFWFDTR